MLYHSSSVSLVLQFFTLKKPFSASITISTPTPTPPPLPPPQECFREKDYLSHRYHVRRALYLAELARQLAGCDWVKEVRWSTFLNDPRKPLLVVVPGEGVRE